MHNVQTVWVSVSSFFQELGTIQVRTVDHKIESGNTCCQLFTYTVQGECDSQFAVLAAVSPDRPFVFAEVLMCLARLRK